MPCTIGIGKQDFVSLREGNYFYLDKTKLISQWWESGDSVTLITRPRRFGKTLNMSMLDCFFSKRYADRFDLFSGLEIWNEEKYQKLQGTYPVIFLSFADVKQNCYTDTVQKIRHIIGDTYRQHRYLLDTACFADTEKQQFIKVMNCEMDDVTAQDALKNLSYYLHHFWEKRVLILLDEYDTPMQEAYVHGYWNEFTSFIRSLFNATFKTNPYLERGMMTGITRVSKESVFSDLNNLSAITTTSKRYADCFGFTEAEVFASLEQFGLIEQKEEVKRWYDGFTFGSKRDVYNPWSITNFLREKTFMAYWAATSGNTLINKLIRTASAEIKEGMEDLLQGGKIVVTFDEQIVFDQLDHVQNAIWSLLVASGYLRVEQVEYRGAWRKPWYHLMITNLETLGMFSDMFSGWFEKSGTNYNAFIEALLKGNIKEMNAYMNDVALTTFSSFDTGNHPSERTQPERFYHGFVLGLLVELRDAYLIRSNRESGLGRYDVMLIPQKPEFDGIILEFKVREVEEETSLGDTVQAALKQIQEKQYDRELIAHGVSEDRIRCYGFAFEGKRVLIGTD